MISHRVWRSRFNADPTIAGRAIRVNGISTTVVGVMPPELLIIGTDMWLPLQASPSAWPRGARQFTILARIADEATLQQVNAELGALAARTTAAFGSEFKEYDGWRLTATPWADVLTRTLQPAAANRVRHGLIVAEIALAMILLAGAGLLVRTMIHLSRLESALPDRAKRRRTAREAPGHSGRDFVDRS